MPGLIPHFPALPLAQMNTTVGGSGASSAPAPQQAAPPAAQPAANATAPTASATGTTTSTAPGSPTVPPPADAAKPNSVFPIIMVVVMLGLLYVFMMRGQKKDEKKRKQMIGELKKGDQVMTIGGMLARVVSIDGDEVVLKIDESANVKATYRKSAIQEVFPDKADKK